MATHVGYIVIDILIVYVVVVAHGHRVGTLSCVILYEEKLSVHILLHESSHLYIAVV